MHSVLSDVARDWLPASRVYGRQTNTVLLLASRDNVNFGAKNINICLNFASRGDQFGKLTRELQSLARLGWKKKFAGQILDSVERKGARELCFGQTE